MVHNLDLSKDALEELERQKGGDSWVSGPTQTTMDSMEDTPVELSVALLTDIEQVELSSDITLIRIDGCKNLPNMDWGFTSSQKTDAFVQVSLHEGQRSGGRRMLPGTTMQRTRTVDDDLDPEFDQILKFPKMLEENNMVVVRVYDEDLTKDDDEIGFAMVPAAELARSQGSQVTITLDLSEAAIDEFKRKRSGWGSSSSAAGQEEEQVVELTMTLLTEVKMIPREDEEDDENDGPSSRVSYCSEKHSYISNHSEKNSRVSLSSHHSDDDLEQPHEKTIKKDKLPRPPIVAAASSRHTPSSWRAKPGLDEQIDHLNEKYYDSSSESGSEVEDIGLSRQSHPSSSELYESRVTEMRKFSEEERRIKMALESKPFLHNALYETSDIHDCKVEVRLPRQDIITGLFQPHGKPLKKLRRNGLIPNGTVPSTLIKGRD